MKESKYNKEKKPKRKKMKNIRKTEIATKITVIMRGMYFILIKINFRRKYKITITNLTEGYVI